MKFNILITTLMLLLLTGCITPKPTPAQNVKLPETFTMTGKQKLQPKWWEVFEDSELNRLIEHALISNLSLQATWERLNQARAVALKNGASLYPSLSLSSEASRVENGVNKNNFSAGVAASYEVDLWGRINNIADASLLDVKASKENLLSASISLSAEIASTWYRLKEQHNDVSLLKSQIEINKKHLQLAERKFRSAQAKVSDIIQQRQIVESSKGEAILTSGRIKLLENQLALLLGENATTLKYLNRNDFTIATKLPKMDVASELLMQRPDVKVAYYKLQASNRRLASAVAEQYPKLTISASLRSSSLSASDIFTNWLSTLVANISAPLFDANMRESEVQRSEAQRDEQLYLYSNTLLNALKEVEDSISKIQHQKRYLDSLTKQIEFSSSSLEQLRQQYIHANTSFVSFLNAQLSLQSLQRKQISASRELIENTISLHRALASGWVLKRNKPITRN